MKTLQLLLVKKQIKSLKIKMKSQRSDIERHILIADGKRKGIDEVIRQNERINNNLKFQV